MDVNSTLTFVIDIPTAVLPNIEVTSEGCV